MLVTNVHVNLTPSTTTCTTTTILLDTAANMAEYVLVKSDSDGDGKQEEIVELPVEDDGTLLLSVVKSQFERATGLKYRLIYQKTLDLIHSFCTSFFF